MSPSLPEEQVKVNSESGRESVKQKVKSESGKKKVRSAEAFCEVK